MSDAFTYNVVTNGDILASFEPNQVRDAFAQLFKISPEKSNAYLSGKQVLKKDLNLVKAHLYKQKLESIGLAVELEPVPLKPANQPGELQLTPLEDEIQVVTSELIATPAASEFCCPKCSEPQVKGEYCIGCGVYFQKLEQLAAKEPGVDRQSVHGASAEPVYSVTESFKILSFFGCGAAALIGALIWLGIAVVFDYELGLVAWLIGGMIGYGAIFTGSSGQTTGIICALFTVLAIFGGKYMAIESFQSQWSEMASSAEFQSEEFREAFAEEKLIAAQYLAEMNDTQAVRQLMLDYQYSDAMEVDEITPQEISDFETFAVPRLLKLATSEPTFEQWLEDSFNQIENFSTIEIIKQDFGFIDFIFLLLGVATAFRLGSGLTQETN